MSRANKLLINNPNNCVDEMLESIAKQNPGLKLLQGHRVIVRDDVRDFRKSGKVSLVCGGGAGHEPAAAGFVGQGMLTAAVIGSVFTSPPPRDILAAIKCVASPSGVLLIVANYTGDRLNFGIALERAKALNLQVKMVIVGEDCALESQDKTAGRRGLVGIMAVMKIAGALSEQGKSLDYIASTAMRAASNMGTIGVSLTGCSIPGRGSSFILDASEMELGLGAHGEAGVKRLKLQSADDTVQTMINHMTNPLNSSRLEIQDGDKLSLIMNNLGGLSVLEMHLLTRKAISFLEDRGCTVARLYFGHFITSLDMSGFNLNVLKLDDELVNCLDAVTNAPAWPRGSRSADGGFERENQYVLPFSEISFSVSSVTETDEKINYLVGVNFLEAIRTACNALIENEKLLNELDTLAGDGDCGSTVKRGADEILTKMPEWSNKSIQTIFLNIAACAEETMGGASGGLYSLFFTAAAGAVTDCSVNSLISALNAGINAVSKYGGAKPGDRTMLDTLIAVQKCLKKSCDLSIVEIAKSVSSASTSAAKATVNMKARAGRASYVAPQHLTQPDPGATAVSIWVQAIAEYVIL